MKLKAWLAGVVAGAGAGIAVAAAMSYLDWRLNPGGIFHDAGSTHWPVVWDTAISWFLPVATIVAVLTWLILFILSRRH